MLFPGNVLFPVILVLFVIQWCMNLRRLKLDIFEHYFVSCLSAFPHCGVAVEEVAVVAACGKDVVIISGCGGGISSLPSSRSPRRSDGDIPALQQVKMSVADMVWVCSSAEKEGSASLMRSSAGFEVGVVDHRFTALLSIHLFSARTVLSSAFLASSLAFSSEYSPPLRRLFLIHYYPSPANDTYSYTSLSLSLPSPFFLLFMSHSGHT